MTISHEKKHSDSILASVLPTAERIMQGGMSRPRIRMFRALELDRPQSRLVVDTVGKVYRCFGHRLVIGSVYNPGDIKNLPNGQEDQPAFYRILRSVPISEVRTIAQGGSLPLMRGFWYEVLSD